MTVSSHTSVSLKSEKKRILVLNVASGVKNRPITQVAQSSVVNERVVQVDLLQKGIFVVQKVPAELAALVCDEPLCLANKPEDTKGEDVVIHPLKDETQGHNRRL